jgi:branched-subunit amino acid aminotransferase/4-amino-4-deoxychorismate lyase
MPIPIGIVKPGGVTNAPYVAASLADAATREPQGVYTVGCTFRRDHALLLDEHFDRLEQSAQLVGMTIRLDRPALRKALRSLIDQSGYAESRFRITIPRETPHEAIISLEAFRGVPPEILQNGARVVTVHLERHNPTAKWTEWMTARKATVEAFAPGIYEGILVAPDGALLEGTNTNFLAIRDQTLRTAGDNIVLSGIGRRVALIVAPDVLPVQLEPVHVDEIPHLSESFLTSASRGIVPIVEIDGHQIGNGRPGPYTLRLREAYDAWASTHLEPI